DGIRDLIVTGVQTCALPIFESGQRRVVPAADHGLPIRAQGDNASTAKAARWRGEELPGREVPDDEAIIGGHDHLGVVIDGDGMRSEERRVGKEWRSRWGRVQ